MPPQTQAARLRKMGYLLKREITMTLRKVEKYAIFWTSDVALEGFWRYWEDCLNDLVELLMSFLRHFADC